METVTDLFSWAPKSLQTVTAAMIQRHLLLGRKARINLNSVVKSRDITLHKSPSSESYGFSNSHVQMWKLEHKHEGWVPRIDAFKLWSWRRLLRAPRTARGLNQSMLKEIPEYSLEGLMLKLKLQYYGHLLWRANLLEKTLMLGKTEHRRRRRQQRIRW